MKYLIPLLAIFICSCASLNWYGYSDNRQREDDSKSNKQDGSKYSNKEEGIASWYGKDFQGKKTASGEAFDMNKLTAAHKKLPFGTMVKVTLIKSGKTVTVRINDRGPYVEGRIIDLSYEAAKQIGLDKAGVGKVRIEW
jgi:rare lipoprotein A